MMSGRRSPAALKGLLTRGLTVLCLLIPVAGVACPLCYEAARKMVTIGQRLDMADRTVIAVPAGDGKPFRVVEVIKGSDTIGEVITEPVSGFDTTASTARDPCLLVRDPLAQQWTELGTMGAEYADWLRQLAATFLVKGDRPGATWPRNMQLSSMLSYAGWRQRIALVLPYLENSEPLVAQIAWGEIARAPYAVMDVARSRIDPKPIEGWLNDPKLAPRHAAYILLLGFAGGPADAARLEQRIEAARNAHESTDLAAMIGADLELRGPARVDWVETAFFADRTRTMPEIEAALVALSVHGDANRSVPRARVIDAYRTFIRERPQMAGFVAQQLADWGCWDAAAEYATLLRSQVIKDQGSELAVQNYLLRAAAAGAPLR